MSALRIAHIDEVLPHVEGRKDFVIKYKQEYTVIDYVYELDDTFDNEYRRECRGLKFTPEGDILARPFHKFFNFNQTPETQAAVVDMKRPHVIMEKADGCLSGRTLIEMCSGEKVSLHEIIRKKMVGPIWGKDADNNIVPVTITNWLKGERTADWLSIVVEDKNNGKGKRTLELTHNHLCFTPRGWIRADCLTKDDHLWVKRKSFSKIQQAVLLGTLLGDASMFKSGGTLLCTWGHSAKNDAYVSTKDRIFSKFELNKRDITSGFGSTMRQRRLCCAEPLKQVQQKTFSGKKIVSREWLDNLDAIALAIWYMDDGSMSEGRKGKQRPRADLHTEGFSLQENEIIKKWFDDTYGFSVKIQKTSNYHHIRLNANDAEIFWKMIKDYISPEMQYKLPEYLRTETSFWDHYESEALEDVGVWLPIKQILNGRSDKTRKGSKYDITTTSENFFANDLLVHNSMIHSSIINERVVLMTRMGHTDVAQKAESLLTYDICAVIRELMQKAGATPIFEYTAPDNRIIIKYPTANLTLLAIRGTKTGAYWDQENVEYYAKKMGVPAISVWESDDRQNAADLVKWGRQVKDMEGFVIRFHDNGQMIKLKGDDYVVKHRAKDGIQQEKNALLTVLNGTFDDVLPLLDTGDADMLRKFNADVNKGINATVVLVETLVRIGATYDQKTFATVILNGVPTILHKFCYLVRRGEDALKVITEHLIKSCSTNANVEQHRPIFNAKWNL
jgi:RNA ligase